MMMMMMMMLSNVDLIFDDVCHQRRFLNHKWVLFFFSQEFIWEKKMTGKFSDCVELLFKETTGLKRSLHTKNLQVLKRVKFSACTYLCMVYNVRTLKST